MNCATHSDTAAVAFCRTCGKPLCNQCTRDVRGVIYCESCLAARMEGAALRRQRDLFRPRTDRVSADRGQPPAAIPSRRSMQGRIPPLPEFWARFLLDWARSTAGNTPRAWRTWAFLWLPSLALSSDLPWQADMVHWNLSGLFLGIPDPGRHPHGKGDSGGEPIPDPFGLASDLRRPERTP